MPNRKRKQIAPAAAPPPLCQYVMTREEERYWFREFLWEHCVRFVSLADVNDSRPRGMRKINGFDFGIVNERLPRLLVFIVVEMPTKAQIRRLAEREQSIKPRHMGLFVIDVGGEYRAMTLTDVNRPDAIHWSKPFVNYLDKTYQKRKSL